jgi:hypothetical protein
MTTVSASDDSPVNAAFWQTFIASAMKLIANLTTTKKKVMIDAWSPAPGVKIETQRRGGCAT